MKNNDVVRIMIHKDEDRRLTNIPVEELIEHLLYAGVLHHISDQDGYICFDILPPASIKNPQRDTWAKSNADRISSFGHNAVVAPEDK